MKLVPRCPTGNEQEHGEQATDEDNKSQVLTMIEHSHEGKERK